MLSEGNSVATQTVNADASILLSDFALVDDRIEGSWRVDTTSDDDYMGFVFGYQDSQHFYLFDWKQFDQGDALGFAERGMSVKVVDAESSLTGSDLWPTAGNPGRVSNIFHNTIGWNDLTDYQFSLEFHPGEFTIEIRQGSTVLESISLFDGTYTSGGFGFYNYSQGLVEYTGFTREVLATRTYAYDVDAIDPDGDPLAFSLVIAPTGMTIDAGTGEITWPVTSNEVGSHEVTVRVEDGRGGFDEQSYTIDVSENHPPEITSTPVTDATEGELYTYDVEATDPDVGDALTFSLDVTPNSMSINSDTGLIQWTPGGAQVGNNPVTVRVEDAGGLFDTQNFTVAVASALVTVPDVVGLSQSNAESAIVAAGLTVGGVTTQNSDTVPAGDVISQDPVAGTSVAIGSGVDIVVSLGPVLVTVPDVVGLSQSNAESAIVAAGLVVGVITTQNSDPVPAGDVISQDPVAGTSVAIGSGVDIVVSLGPVLVTVPDVVGLSGSNAESAIVAAGLTVGGVTPQNSDTVPAGDVISQDPVAGTSVAVGSAVDIVVSLGPVLVTVPDVVGLSQSGAESAIVAAGLTVGGVSTQNSDTVPAGNVISQDPGGGTSVTSGSAVDIVVSLGPVLVTVLDVVGLSQSDAESAIVAAGLVVGVATTQNSDTVPAGDVISQDPVAGASVAIGSAVDIVVSLGPVLVTVPDVVGLPQSTAESAIVAAGLVVGVATTQNSATVPAPAT